MGFILFVPENQNAPAKIMGGPYKEDRGAIPG